MNRLKLAAFLLTAFTTSSVCAMCPSQPMDKVSFIHHGKKINLTCRDGSTYGIHSNSGEDEHIDTAVCHEEGSLLRASWVVQSYSFALENLNHEILGEKCSFSDEDGWTCKRWTKVQNINFFMDDNKTAFTSDNCSFATVSSPMSSQK